MLVYIDTNIFIYLLEDNGDVSVRVADKLDEFRQLGYSFITSALTITEFLAGSEPITIDFLKQIPRLSIIPLDENIAVRAGKMQQMKLRIGDAVHVATAECVKATIFFTNDTYLVKNVPSNMRAQTV